MKFFTAIIQFFATIFSPLRHPGGRGSGGGNPGIESTSSEIDADLERAEAIAKRKKIVATVAVVVIVGSLGSLYLTMVPPKPKINRQPFIGLGQVLALETAKALNDRGRIALVIAEYHRQSGTPLSDQYAEFCKTMKTVSGVEIAATEIVVADETMPGYGSGLSSKQFADLLTKHASLNALVFFTGLPDAQMQRDLQIPEKHPKLIAIHNNLSPAKQYFEQGIAEVLIVPRMTPPDAAAAEPTTPRGWFDKYFEVYTTKNFQSLPY